MKGLAICHRCGHIHFLVTRKYAEEEVKKFNEYFDTLTKEEQEEYYGGKKSSIVQYEHCELCGDSYKNMAPYNRSKDADITGCTLNPIIYWGE